MKKVASLIEAYYIFPPYYILILSRKSFFQLFMWKTRVFCFKCFAFLFLIVKKLLFKWIWLVKCVCRNKLMEMAVAKSKEGSLQKYRLSSNRIKIQKFREYFRYKNYGQRYIGVLVPFRKMILFALIYRNSCLKLKLHNTIWVV